MLEAIKLCKAFDGRPVIQDFSIRLKPGSRVCLTGPSGSGKTTLLRLLMGLEKPDSGTLSMPRGTHFSAVFQENRLLEQLTAEANVALVSAAPRQEIAALLNALGLDAKSLAQPVSTFSGGMKRRAALCRALLAPYDILCLDEPYKGLDEALRAQVMRIVDEHTRGKTVVLVTHDLREAEGYELIQLPPLPPV